MEENALGRQHHLKHRKEIENLFSNGEVLKKYPVLLKYSIETIQSDISYKIGFSVSKRNFKRAVDRNKIKRQLREGFRNNKSMLIKLLEKDNIHLTMMLLYTGNQTLDTADVHRKIAKIIELLTLKIAQNDTK